MSIVDSRGVRVARETKPKPKAETARDMILIGLRKQGLSFRDIGRILKISHQAVHLRWKAIPEDARKHYTRALD